MILNFEIASGHKVNYIKAHSFLFMSIGYAVNEKMKECKDFEKYKYYIIKGLDAPVTIDHQIVYVESRIKTDITNFAKSASLTFEFEIAPFSDDRLGFVE